MKKINEYNSLRFRFCEVLIGYAIIGLEARKTYPQTFRLCEVKKVA